MITKGYFGFFKDMKEGLLSGWPESIFVTVHKSLKRHSYSLTLERNMWYSALTSSRDHVLFRILPLVCVRTPSSRPSEFPAHLLFCFYLHSVPLFPISHFAKATKSTSDRSPISADQMSSGQRLGPDTFCRGAGQALKAQRGIWKERGVCHNSRHGWA